MIGPPLLLLLLVVIMLLMVWRRQVDGRARILSRLLSFGFTGLYLAIFAHDVDHTGSSWDYGEQLRCNILHENNNQWRHQIQNMVE